MSLKAFLSFRFIFGALLLAIFFAVYWQYFSYQRFLSEPLKIDRNAQVIVKKGQGLSSLAKELTQKKIISNYYYLRLYCYLNPERSKLKLGEYLLDESDTPVSLMEKISKGKVIQYPFTIVEGANSFQILNKLAEESKLEQDWGESEADLLNKLSIKHDKLEGWLFPDTYYYTKGASALALLKQANQKMNNVLNELWQNRSEGLPYESAYEALIMASIIEKETGIASERDMIAGVFVRRLQKNMRLQTDPTVIYGIGPEFDGDITYKHLRTPTAYNTYVIRGLPPTPIAMPGKEAIHAALNPAGGEWLYFVATGDGGHKFSETLEEHNKAVKAYLNRLKSSN
ncbi:endolytic transglycosylase MltG [Aliikangiella sp. G2MR2-5]|uniref:endolytic transglycosylase MltG n=1 Tax=Aliikangiella sp. G2MR2-5 TaxID=2788943 RepID=UPI0018ABDB3B|nr:endolytic transglycosylase MltG [Aliikangiella sp. G2MR2-5]